MARNPYSVLGVAPSASDSDIRAAFRNLAKKHHPDRNPGDKKAEEKFKEISAAFDILGDADRRRKYDRGEIDADGRERASGYTSRDWRGGPFGAGGPFGPGAGGARTGGGYSQGAGMGGGPNSGMGGGGAGGGDFADLSDIFADLFGARPQEGRSHGFERKPRGRDLRYRLEVDFIDAARGAKKRVTMPDGRTLNISVPAGIDDGQTLRLKGQGEAPTGGIPGDVYVEVAVKSHAIFERDGDDIHIEAPISLREAVLGGRITVPTVTGDVAVTVPKSANSGTVLRLKGRGIQRANENESGDQFVKLKIVLPEGGDAELEEFVRKWKGGESQTPRKHFEGA